MAAWSLQPTDIIRRLALPLVMLCEAFIFRLELPLVVMSRRLLSLVFSESQRLRSGDWLDQSRRFLHFTLKSCLGAPAVCLEDRCSAEWLGGFGRMLLSVSGFLHFTSITGEIITHNSSLPIILTKLNLFFCATFQLFSFFCKLENLDLCVYFYCC